MSEKLMTTKKVQTYALPEFEEGPFEWDGYSHIEGKRVRPDDVWLARKGDPFRRNPATDSNRTLAENFKYMGQLRLNLLAEAITKLTPVLTDAARKDQYRASLVVSTINEELRVMRNSFERGINHPIRVIFDEDPLPTAYLKESVEILSSNVFFQIDQLRNCAKQDNYAYTVKQLSFIYSVLHGLIKKLERVFELDTDLTVKRIFERTTQD